MINDYDNDDLRNQEEEPTYPSQKSDPSPFHSYRDEEQDDDGEIDDDDDDKREDFFNSEGPEVTPKPTKEKTKKISSESPEYWDRDESRWAHLRPSNTTMIWLWLVGCLLTVGLLWWAYIKVFGTYKDVAVEYGYVMDVSKEGKVFKTFEGRIIPYREITDTLSNPVYEKDFVFSIANDTLAARLFRMMDTGRPVKVIYKAYNSVMPWRGNTPFMVTDVDSANPRNLLPPDLSPARIRE